MLCLLSHTTICTQYEQKLPFLCYLRVWAKALFACVLPDQFDHKKLKYKHNYFKLYSVYLSYKLS